MARSVAANPFWVRGLSYITKRNFAAAGGTATHERTTFCLFFDVTIVIVKLGLSGRYAHYAGRKFGFC